MAKLYIFAIGGTGERVMRSVTMLMAAGVPAFDAYDIYPIIIDYDQKNKDKDRTQALLKSYRAVHRAAYSRHTTRTGSTDGNPGMSDCFFGPEITDITTLDDKAGDFIFPFSPATENEKFRDYIGFDHLTVEHRLTNSLLQSLYDMSDRPDTELNLSMEKGFKGNPNIGSVVFNDIENEPTFRRFVSNFDPQNDKAVIIGSIFGGTGASGIPEIVKAINAKIPNADIATLLIEPYFAPEERKNGAIQASRFNAKTVAALSFYDASGLKRHISSIYNVGDFKPTTVPYSEGGADQLNMANLVELVSAIMVAHFATLKNKNNTNQSEYKFAIDADLYATDQIPATERLFLKHLDPQTLDSVMRHLVELAIALKTVHDDITHQTKYFKPGRAWFDALGLEKAIKGDSSDLADLIAALNEFHGQYQDWLKELDWEGGTYQGRDYPANSHRMAIADMTRPYPDLVLREAEKTDHNTKKTSILDAIGTFLNSNTQPGLSDDYLSAKLEEAFHSTDEKGHFEQNGSRLRPNHEAEWAFADILRFMALKAYDEIIKPTL